MDDREQRYQRAQKQVKKLKGFYEHLATFISVNVMLLVINLLTSPESLWFVWPLMGWGVGLFSHAVSVYGLFGRGGRRWEERKIQEIMLRGQLEAHDADLGLRTSEEALPSLERITRRLENLETIVTSRSWEQLEQERPEASGEETPAEKAAELARRTRK